MSAAVLFESLSVLVLAKPVVLSGMTSFAQSRNRGGLRGRLEIVDAFKRVDKRWLHLILVRISALSNSFLFDEHHTFWSTIAFHSRATNIVFFLRQIVSFVNLAWFNLKARIIVIFDSFQIYVHEGWLGCGIFIGQLHSFRLHSWADISRWVGQDNDVIFGVGILFPLLLYHLYRGVPVHN